MIRDLSETLGSLLTDKVALRDFPELTNATISFDRPVEKFSPDHATINLFLYDVRENMELRSNEPQVTRSNGEVTIGRPPLRIACSYLLTAWPGGLTDVALQEHRLLSQALQALSMYPTIPPAYLKGNLRNQAPPLPMMTARTDGLKDPAEFWTALGNQLRAAIVVTATIGMDVNQSLTPVYEVTSAQLRFGQRVSPNAPGLSPSADPPSFQIAGRVTWTGGGPVPGATVSLVELGLVGATDADGCFRLGAMAAGHYTVNVKKDALAKNVNVVVHAKTAPACDVQLPGPPSTS